MQKFDFFYAILARYYARDRKLRIQKHKSAIRDGGIVIMCPERIQLADGSMNMFEEPVTGLRFRTSAQRFAHSPTVFTLE
jgi:hypothetical protein